jgi:hypothetical protein
MNYLFSENDRCLVKKKCGQNVGSVHVFMSKAQSCTLLTAYVPLMYDLDDQILRFV